MRKFALAACALLVASAVIPAGAARDPRVVALTRDPGVGGFLSPNVTYVGTIPDTPGVGGRVVRVGDQVRFYVTGIKGLTIYDVTNPAIPLLIGAHPLPHWENEDVEVSADGTRTVISFEDFGFNQAYVFDTTIPSAPHITHVVQKGAHTVTCVDDACDWLYSRSGDIYDLTMDGAVPGVTPVVGRIIPLGWRNAIEAQGVELAQRAHDFNVDEAGYLISDTVPRVMMDVSDPLNPVVLTTGSPPDGSRLAYQHNNLRPRALDWTPRAPGDNSAALLPGELLLGQGETNFTGTCGTGSGPFATWSLANWDRGEPMRHLDTYRPVSGNWADGNPMLNGLGCSGHWFTERDDIVASGFYEHGTRFLHVEPTTGEITEVGYFQPVVGSNSDANWIDDEYVYTVDYARGIDILRFDRDAPAPSLAEIEASWLAKAGAPRNPIVEAERLNCQLAVD